MIVCVSSPTNRRTVYGTEKLFENLHKNIIKLQDPLQSNIESFPYLNTFFIYLMTHS